MKIVNKHLNYPKAELITPNSKGYIQIAAQIDSTPFPFFIRMSKKKREIIKYIDNLLTSIAKLNGIETISSFKTMVIPPAKHAYFEKVKSNIHVANFDYAILIEAESVEIAKSIRHNSLMKNIEEYLKEQANDMHISTFKNARRIHEVDKTTKGVFLFNYFYAADVKKLLPVWEYTAGWFTKETGLNNSTLLIPLEGEPSDFGVINHCKWDKLFDFLPSLLFKKSLRRYVVDNFDANQIASMPMLYKVIKNYNTEQNI